MLQHKPQLETEPSVHWNQRLAVENATARPGSSLHLWYKYNYSQLNMALCCQKHMPIISITLDRVLIA